MNLPQELDPLKASQANQTFEGSLTPVQCLRVEGLISAKYSLKFSLTEKDEPKADLILQAKINLICHRCNQAMLYEIDETISLEETEPFNPIQLLEDEMILALPMIPLHKKGACASSQNQAYSPVQNENTYKPFANLSKTLDL